MGETTPIPDEMQEKCNRVIDMLAKREESRKKVMENNKNKRENLEAENEKLAFFEQSFGEKFAEIEQELFEVKEIPIVELADHFNTISKSILTLQKYLASSSIFLKTFAVKKYQEKLQELTNKSRELEDIYLPKKRFGFKNKKAKVETAKIDKDETDFARQKKIEYNISGFRNKVGEVFELKQGEVDKKDVELHNLEDCTVKIFGAPSTLQMSKLKNCFVFSGPVSTSVFIENCENCTFVVACQQLRLHSSLNVNIYLHVTSRAIIEDSSQIYFAPYNFSYDNIVDDFKTAGLDFSKNNWREIDDFNWLNTKKQSPNWHLIELSKMTSNWNDYLLKKPI